jgi:hypothetical protein
LNKRVDEIVGVVFVGENKKMETASGCLYGKCKIIV